MSAAGPPNNTTTDVNTGRRRRQRRRRHKSSIACSSGTTTDGSVCFSDSGEEEQTWRSGGSYDECRSSEIEGISISNAPSRQESGMSENCLSEIDLESGELEMEVHYYSGTNKKRKKKKKMEETKEERECRICHLNLVGDEQDFGVAIELNCDCKGDLGTAHKQCAETWFKIRGNTTCEICGAIALNVVGPQTHEANNIRGEVPEATTGPEILYEARSFCHGRRIMNILLACMILAFIISWLFHFHVLP